MGPWNLPTISKVIFATGAALRYLMVKTLSPAEQITAK